MTLSDALTLRRKMGRGYSVRRSPRRGLTTSPFYVRRDGRREREPTYGNREI